MNRDRNTARRARSLFGAALVVFAAALAFTPAVPPVGAIDPTPAPSESPAPDPSPAPTPDPSIAPSPDPSPDPSPAPTPDPSPAPTPDPSIAPSPDPSIAPSPDPSIAPSPDPSAEPSPDPSAEPSPSPSPEPVQGTVVVTSDAPTVGRHRIDPGDALQLTIAGRIETPASGVRLVASLPDGWTVLDADGGLVDSTAGIIAWPVGDVLDRTDVFAAPRFRAPLHSPAGEPAFRATFGARLEHADGLAASDSVTVLVAPALVVEHSVFARVEPVTQAPAYLATDRDLTGVLRFDSIRLRFQVRNADLPAASLVPRLQYRLGGTATFIDVPVGDSERGVPLYVGAEWRRNGATGTLPGPGQEPIHVGDIAIRDTDDVTQDPAAGRRVMGEAGETTIAVPGDAYTEVEFTVRASIDLPPGRWFEFRLTDGGTAIPGATTASLISEATPRIDLTPGQHGGVFVTPPTGARPSSSEGGSGVDFPLVAPGAIAATWSEPPSVPLYRLAVAVPNPASDAQGPLFAPFTSPHAPDTSLVSDTCSACHPAHSAQSDFLLSTTAPQEALCLACHNGTGSNLNVEAQLADPAVPANSPASRDYYRHDVVAEPNLACVSCHNAHNTTATASTETTTGWTVAGAQATVAGLAPNNGTAGTTPIYTILDGEYGRQPTREYEICFSCHAGWALQSNTGQPASRYELDKGVELNPSNASYHPVEAAGTNGTAAMSLSLSGTSPYKQWDFTTGSTVRCLNCHGDPRAFNATNPPAAGSDLAPHSSENRGILIQGYRDRVLKSSGEPYAAADSALCLVCHAEEGFVSSSSSATNFRLHQEHLTGIGGKGDGGTGIDTPGAGQGNAVCAECHFRIHGTALAYQVNDRSNPRLVNFAPDVLPAGGTLRWTPTGIGAGSCTLTCHGYDHVAKTYGP